MTGKTGKGGENNDKSACRSGLFCLVTDGKHHRNEKEAVRFTRRLHFIFLIRFILRPVNLDTRVKNIEMCAVLPGEPIDFYRSR